MVTSVARADAAEVVEDEKHRLLSDRLDTLARLARRGVATDPEERVREAVCGCASDSIAATARRRDARANPVDGDQKAPEVPALGRAPDDDSRLRTLGPQLPERDLSLEVGDALELALFRARPPRSGAGFTREPLHTPRRLALPHARAPILRFFVSCDRPEFLLESPPRCISSGDFRTFDGSIRNSSSSATSLRPYARSTRSSCALWNPYATASPSFGNGCACCVAQTTTNALSPKTSRSYR